MKIIHPQYKKGILVLSDADIAEMNKEYKENQPIKCKVTRVSPKMEPSILQNNTLFKCFEMLSGSSDHYAMQNVEGVKEACKIGIDFRDPGFVILRPDGGIQFKYRSFSFKSLPASKEREEVMQKAFEWTADMLSITVEDMVEEAKRRMRPR